MKTCSTCRQELPEQMFYRDSTRRDGLKYFCKRCFKESRRPYSRSATQKELHRQSRRREWAAEIHNIPKLLKQLIEEYDGKE